MLLPEIRMRSAINLASTTRFSSAAFSLAARAGFVSSHKARGKDILISPFYFADNLDGLADAAAQSGASAITSVLKKVKDNQGWPLSLVGSTKENWWRKALGD